MGAIDWPVLKTQCAGDEALVRDVVDVYRKTWSALLHDVQQAVGAGDLPATRRTAHRLKGAVLSLAAVASADLAHRLELAAAASDHAGVRALLTELELELARVATELG